MNTAAKNSVCSIIVTFNIGSALHKCFDAINGQTEKIVIVDNGSNEETLTVLKELQKLEHVHIILNKENLGIAIALNQGVKYALEHNYKWILTMDNDSMATNHMVENMLMLYNSLSESEKDKVVSIFPSYIEESELASHSKLIDELSQSFTFSDVMAEITSGNLVRSDIFNKTGFFLEDFFIDYVDIEYCLRLKSKGYRLIKINELFLIHNLGRTERSKVLVKSASYTNHNSLRRYYITRNRIKVWGLYFRRFPSFILKDIYACSAEMIKILLFEENKKKKFQMFLKGIKDAFKGRYGKYSNS